MRRRFLPILLLAAACGHAPKLAKAVIDTLPGGVIRVQNPGPTGWADSAHITFTELQRIQPPDGAPGELGDVMDLAMDPNGTVYITEQGPVRIDRYGPDGRYLGSVGREGGGPGEYEAAMLAVLDGHLVVHDPQSRRTSVFDSAGNYVRSWGTSCCMFRSIGTDTLGAFYVPVPPDGGVMSHEGPGWIRFHLDGTLVDTLWSRPQPANLKFWEFSPGPHSRTRFSIPFQPDVSDNPWPGGGLLIGDNGSYSITIAPHGTDSALVFSRSWTPEAIPDSLRKNALESYTAHNAALKAVARLEDIPTAAPAFSAIVVDAEQRIWIQQWEKDPTGGSYWDIFSPHGVWLGTVHAPFHSGRLVFRRGEVLVATTDANELPVLLRYRLTEPDPAGDRPGVKLGT